MANTLNEITSLPATYTALGFTEFGGELELISVAMPTLAPSEVLIKVVATGLCRSDWHAYMGHDSDVSLPHIPGHEYAGLVVAIGAEIRNFKIGDRVTAPFVNGCGRCWWCRAGQAQVCPDQEQPGFTFAGSFAEYVVAKAGDFNLIPLPGDISFETAAALGCRFATAFRGLTARAKLLPGETVAIFGCGGVGLSAVMIAKSLGAKVIAIDINQAALSLAAELGADEVIDSNTVDAAEQIQQRSGGAHVAVDCLGHPATAQAATMSLRRQGRHLQLGLLLTADGMSPMAMARVIGWELSILGSHGLASVDYPAMLNLVSKNNLQLGKLIAKQVLLEEAGSLLAEMGTNSHHGITLVKP
jgi:alcohol dehydrogenase